MSPPSGNMWNYEELQRVTVIYILCSSRKTRSFPTARNVIPRKIEIFEITTNQPNTHYQQYTLFTNILFLRHNYAQVKKYCKIKRYMNYANHEIQSAKTVRTL
jgi:hypothetical protein